MADFVPPAPNTAAAGSAEARGVADTFWDLASRPDPLWEAVYPPPAA